MSFALNNTPMTPEQQAKSQVIVSNQTIKITTSAANKVFELISEENNLNLKLRVFITGGGCSGFQYGFAFEENTTPDDIIIEANAKPGEPDTANVYFLVDPMSHQYLQGAEIDYIEDIEGERFIIRNPNAQTTCGCGSSFSV